MLGLRVTQRYKPFDCKDCNTGPGPTSDPHTFGIGEVDDGLIHENVNLLNARYCVHS